MNLEPGPAERSRINPGLIRLRNVVLLLTILVVGFVAGSFDRASRIEQPPLPYADTAVMRIASHYYTAIDWLLESGDSVPLADMLDDRFAGRSLDSNQTIGKLAFIDQLLLLRSVAPDARVQHSVASALGDTFSAEIELIGTIPDAYGGIALSPDVTTTGFEMVTLREGKIVSRRGTSFGPLPFSQVATTTIESGAEHLTVASLRRWEVSAGSSVNGSYGHPLVLIAASGAFSIEVASAPGAPALLWQPDSEHNGGHTFRDFPSAPVSIDAGSVILLPGSTAFKLRNQLDQDVHLFVVELAVASEARVSDSFSNGILSELLARGATVERGTGEICILVGRLVLDPDRSWPADRARGAGELVAVHAGNLGLQTGSGSVWTADDQGQMATGSKSLQIGEEHGAAIDRPAEVTYQALGGKPAEIWVVTLSPAN